MYVQGQCVYVSESLSVRVSVYLSIYLSPQYAVYMCVLLIVYTETLYYEIGCML